MLLDRYNENKNAVLKLVEQYLKVRSNYKDGLNEEIFNNRIESLKISKYVLAVVGEVKAGKSTFINALLGESVLPTDVLQSTSAIIEIFKSNQKHLKIKYAGCNQFKEIYDEKEIYDFLNKNACIQERYRKIPVVQINSYIIGQKGKIYNKSLEDFISGLDKTHNISQDEFRNLIYQYIDEHKDLDSIIEEIKFGYPLKHGLDSISLVDSPGVNAVGGIQDITFNYIKNADATIFVSSISAINQQSIYKFIESNVTDKVKETLFLALTHTSHLTKGEVEKLRNEAKNLFSIPEERIIQVDSMLKLLEYKFKDMDMDQIFDYLYPEDEVASDDESEIKAKERKLLADLYMESRRKKEKFLSLLAEGSNFKAIENSINEFAMNAKNYKLISLLNQLKTGCNNQIKNLEEEISFHKKEYIDPHKLEEELLKRKKELDELNIKFQEFGNTLRDEYGATSDNFKNVIKKKEDYKNKIESSKDKLMVEKEVQNIFDEINDILDNIRKQITNKCNDFLQNYEKQINIEGFKIPEIDVESLFVELKSKAVIERKTEEGITFKEVKRHSEYSIQKHLELLVGHVKSKIDERMKKSGSDMDTFIETTISQFENELNNIIYKKKCEYDTRLNQKHTVEQLRKKIEDAESKIEEINDLLNLVNPIWEDLKCCSTIV